MAPPDSFTGSPTRTGALDGPLDANSAQMRASLVLSRGDGVSSMRLDPYTSI